MEVELYPLKEQTFKIIGACMNVHKELGCGFLEPVYQEALAIEFDYLGIPYQREEEIEILYRGVLLNKKYYADFVCYDEIILELKALSALSKEHYSQVINYLKATGFQLALLINFGTKSLEYKRVIL